MRRWDAKDTFNAFETPDSYLDVIFCSEGGAGIQVRSLDKYALYRVEGLAFFFSLKVVKIVQDGAIQIVAKTVGLILG